MKASIDCDDPVVFFEHKAMLKDPDWRAGWEQLQMSKTMTRFRLARRASLDLGVI
jgi:pyruvate/2-oxoglutarate/acetoin dehydrogenase E1 component